MPGLVVRYSYLWQAEHASGREEGVKDRPCAIVISAPGKKVVVLPVTHTPPFDDQSALEIPASTKQRLHLDSERSWVVFTEANLFNWPGPDLRPAINGDLSSAVYGLLPRSFFHAVRTEFLRNLRSRRIRVVTRTE